MRRLWILALCCLTPLAVLANVVKTEHVTAELVAERSAVQPGDSVMVGLRLQHIPHWHTYWRNPGDSGLPTTIDWQLPGGASIGEIEWPAPKRLPIGPLVNYGYEGELLLPALFTAPANARPGQDLVLRARAQWLVCFDVCIPETGSFELRLPVVAAGTIPGHTASSSLFERAADLRSVPLQGWTADLQQQGRDLLLTLQADGDRPLPTQLPGLQFFPYAEQVIDPAVHKLQLTPRGYALQMKLLADAKPPALLQGIAVAQSATGAAFGTAGPSVEFSAPWRQVAQLKWPEGARPASAQPETLGSTGGAARTGLITALALAFVGGMLLNLMPCVFPVLSIKLLSLAQQAKAPAALRQHALAYGAGVLATFLALAAGLIALQAAGSSVGWGFQLQEPGVVFVLALLFFAIGLNLIGALELANLVPQRLLQWDARSPGGDAFGCGVLAVVAASPCTAPFMGAALGFALTQSAAVSLGVFAALGAGMALPYMLLTLLPGWRKRLPRPGPWMQHLRQGLAFPMFATAVWLLWVLGQQAGVGAMARLLMAVVGLGLLAWAAGVGGTRSAWAKALGALAAVGLLAWSWPSELPAATPLARADGRAPAASEGWLAYDETVIADLRAQGKPVFVDFTAAWCVSCQVNKRLVLHTAETQQAFAAANVTLMQADWTRRDPVITQALARLGRNGVPVYVLFRPGREPLLLPEILSQGTVRDALATLQDPRS